MKFQNTTSIKFISILYTVFLSIVFLIPLDSYVVTEIIEIEKHPRNKTSYFIHLIIFFIFHFLFFIAFKNRFKIFIVVIIYSVLIEIFQIFTLRGFQITDIIFNITGVLLSSVFVYYFYKKTDK